MTIVEFGVPKVNNSRSPFLRKEFERVDLDWEIMIIFILVIFDGLLFFFLSLSLRFRSLGCSNC